MLVCGIRSFRLTLVQVTFDTVSPLIRVSKEIEHKNLDEPRAQQVHAYFSRSVGFENPPTNLGPSCRPTFEGSNVGQELWPTVAKTGNEADR